MFTLRPNGTTVRAVHEKDFAELWRWSADPMYQATCTSDRAMSTEERFVRELRKDLDSGRRPAQLIAEVGGKMVGTTWLSGLLVGDGHAFITTYMVPENRGQGIGPALTAAMALYAFRLWPLYKLYLDVLEFNERSRKALEQGVLNLGLAQEARLRGHRFFDGKRWDVLRYALYRESIPALRGLAIEQGSIAQQSL